MEAPVDVAAWLAGLGLGEYAGAFAENHIDAALLADLTDGDLRDLGVLSLGHRKRILTAAARGTGSPPATPPPSPPAFPEGERRPVAILFCDLCGYTALCRTLDPEELRAVAGRYTALADGIIERLGGTVDKHLGDGVMALFGAPIAHRDDPERAVRAALAIHRAMEDLRGELRRDLQVHIGIASGEVVAGAVERPGYRGFSVFGDAVNLAARLQSIAAAGETVISGPVRRELGPAAQCEPLGEVQVKGFEQPLAAFRVRAWIDGAPSVQGPIVGRERELSAWQAALAACCRTRRGQLVVVRGDPGLGKSRLLDEMAAGAAAHGLAVHRGAVLDFGVERGEDAISALARSMVGLPAGAGEDERAATVARAASGGLAVHALALADLIGARRTPEQQALEGALDGGARSRARHAALGALVAAAAEPGGAALLVEDVHWADETGLGHLAALAAAAGTCAALLVLTTRLEGDPIGAAWRATAADPPSTTLDLAPLSVEDALACAAAASDVAEPTRRRCVERAAGSPLFLEQLLRNARDAEGAVLPASLQSAVLARVDRLAAADKAGLQAASVIGQRFGVELLRELLGDPAYRPGALLASGLVRDDGPGLRFAHALLHEVVYASLLKARRRELHGAAAAWFAGRDPVLRAGHLDRAGDAGAPRACLEAAEERATHHDLEAALRLADRGLELVVEPADRHALALRRAAILHDRGAIAEAVEAWRAALAPGGSDLDVCRTCFGLANSLRILDRTEEALAVLDQAEAAAARGKLTSELARLHHLRGNLAFALGRVDEVFRAHAASLEAARATGDAEAEAGALGGLGDGEFARGRMQSAFDRFRRCVELASAHGLVRIEAAILPMVGFCRRYLLDLEAAVDDGLAACRIATTTGNRRAELLGCGCVQTARIEMGQLDLADALFDRSLELSRSLGTRRFESQVLEYRGRTLALRGRLDEARDHVARARELAVATGSRLNGLRLFGVLAKVARTPAERAGALDEGDASLARDDLAHNLLDYYRDAIDVCLADGWLDRAAGYAAALSRLAAVESFAWLELHAERATALIEWGRGRRDADLHARLRALRDRAATARLHSALPAIDAALPPREE